MRRRNERSTRVRMKERGISKMRMARVKVWTQSAITEPDTPVLNHALCTQSLCTQSIMHALAVSGMLLPFTSNTDSPSIRC